MYDEKEKYIEALKKRALGYEFEETTTLVEETKNGTKKRIFRTKKHIPADIQTAKWFLRRLEQKEIDIKDFEEIAKQLKETIKNGDN